MEAKNENAKVKIDVTELNNTDGGTAGKSGSGYCPYTTDRTCHTSQGGWSNDSEECMYCGWRAW